ncbi:hypothetical protein OG884_37270 [Streptosporangium sp. NBC_01755]|uniref:hypothetical protein n=1 Tax=Streptosporangium sp. NBC_01755 TaxID=2975949 RepID=UPI002DD9D548|nr:hypothetical protein [Streptosporangium sp. NBC_01755]WSD00343.1 hypothetical protein OG884_37270 [Streptosporangium sp. NBC_01755]
MSSPLRGAAGRRELFRYPVPTDLDGSDVAIHAHVVTGMDIRFVIGRPRRSAS